LNIEERDSYDSKKLFEYHKKMEEIEQEVKTHEIELNITGRRHMSKNIG